MVLSVYAFARSCYPIANDNLNLNEVEFDLPGGTANDMSYAFDYNNVGQLTSNQWGQSKLISTAPLQKPPSPPHPRHQTSLLPHPLPRRERGKRRISLLPLPRERAGVRGCGLPPIV